MEDSQIEEPMNYEPSEFTRRDEAEAAESVFEQQQRDRLQVYAMSASIRAGMFTATAGPLSDFDYPRMSFGRAWQSAASMPLEVDPETGCTAAEMKEEEVELIRERKIA